MSIRPSPRTPFESRQRAIEEQQFYESHGTPLEARLAGFGAIAGAMAVGLGGLARVLRSLAVAIRKQPVA